MALSITHALSTAAALGSAFDAVQRDLCAIQQQLHQLNVHAASLQGAGCTAADVQHPRLGSSAPCYPHPPETPVSTAGGPPPVQPESPHPCPCLRTTTQPDEAPSVQQVEGLLVSALQAVHVALGQAEGTWRAAQTAIEEGQRRAAAAALAANEHRNPLIADTLSVDAVAVLMTSYLSVKDQCRTQLVSRALAAVTTRSLRALTECTVLGSMPPPVCTFVMRCLPALKSLVLKRTSGSASAASSNGGSSGVSNNGGAAAPGSPQLAPASLTLASVMGRLSLSGALLGSPTSASSPTSQTANGSSSSSSSSSTGTLQSTRHTLEDVLRTCTSITSLRCDPGMDMSDTGLLMFAVYCSGAKCLALPGARVTDVGLHALARASGTLTHLDLSSCAAVTSAALASVARACTRLTSFNVTTTNADNELLVTLGEHCKALTTVKVSWCRGVGDAGILALIDGCPGLQHLETAGNLITDVSLGAVGRISRLDVGRCRLLKHPGFATCFWGPGRPAPLLEFKASAAVGITDETLLALAQCSPRLRSLDISLCVVTDVGVLGVVTGCPHLVRLSVAGLPITDAVIMQIPDSLTHLRKLDVSGCHTGLQPLLCMHSLRVVQASRCEGATPEWRQAAVQRGMVIHTG